MKKIIIAIIILTLLICTGIMLGRIEPDNIESSTSAQPTTLSTVTTPRTVSLGYYEGKAFNPYTTKSPANLKISTLLYDSLFIINNDWSVDKLLAAEFSNEGTQITVKVIDDAVFSNGATLSAYDVVYSFNLAKKSVFFKGRLSNFDSAAIDTNKVIFTLKQADAYAQNCLTFPIVQNNTGNAAVPIGSGRYILINNEGNYVLTENSTSTRGEVLTTKQINLVPLTSEDNQVYGIQTGELSYFYDDLSSGKITNINANTETISTNTLIYLGFNSNNSFFSENEIINALCYGIDKATITDTVYDNICTACSVPFNPNWYALKGLELPSYEYNIIKAGEILSNYGYNFSGTTEQYRLNGSEHLTLRLIVNEESETKIGLAKIVRDNLKSLGINIEAEALSFSDYQAALKSGDFDLYVGEVKISPNMDLSSFFTKGASTSYGISHSSTTAKAYSDFRAGSIDAATFIEVFDGNKPFIPICFKGAVAYYSKEINFDSNGNEYEPFRYIYSWNNKNANN